MSLEFQDMMGLATGKSPMNVFQGRYRDLQTQQNSSQSLIQDLLLYCEQLETTLQNQTKKLSGELRDSQLDLADATKSRRGLQQQLETAETNLQWLSRENSNLKNRNPYVLLLIDGDGLIFNNRYVRQGIEGGKAAAYALRAAIAEQCYERANEVEIIAKVVANLGGLGKAMVRDGSIDSVQDLKDFALGFTQAKASFDFIDVGHGKERADSKIKETTRWNLRNHNCKQILLGISHDAGYAPFLDEIFQEEETRQRITILEGFPVVREIVSTSVAVMRLDNELFREDKLIDRSTTTFTLTPVRATAAPSPPLTNPSVSPTITKLETTSRSASYADASKLDRASPEVSGPAISKPIVVPGRTKTAPPAPQPVKQKSDWNPGPRGLDKPVQASHVAMDSIKRRKDNNKLCNNHFLRRCPKGDACPFIHDYDATQDELNAIALLSRMNPCKMGQDCDADDCIYGHHCPSIKDGICQHPYCHFSEDAHPPGTKYKSSLPYVR